jgi:hypothetical protein
MMNTGVPRDSPDAGAPRLIQWFGPSGARWVWLLIGLLYVGFVAGSSVVMILHALRADQWLRVILIAVTALLALGLWLRIWLINWRSLQADWPPIRPEDTGIWGVGGPGIRQPGATGIFPKAKVADDEEPGGG